MKKTTALTLAVSMALGLFLSGCTVERVDGNQAATDTPDSSSTAPDNNSSSNGKRVLNVCSWGEYIADGLEEQFEEATGIEVNYVTVPSNEELYSLLQSGGVNYDVIVPSDYMISQLIEEDMLQELDYSKIPNFEKIDARFKNLSYDPENLYTVPYTWGTLGIIYNTTMVDEPITSWDVMFSDQYKGNVMLIDNSRDAFGMALYSLGYSVNTTDEAQIREAYELVADAWNRGVYQGRVMDEIFQLMEGGNAAVATYYAGDFLSMHEVNPDLAYCVPEEGSNWFVDAMCILKDAKNVEEAHEWINFMASTEANLQNMDFIWYASPNTEALEMYPEWYEEQYGEPLDMELYEIMAAPQEVLDRCEAYLVLPYETRLLYNELWVKLGTCKLRISFSPGGLPGEFFLVKRSTVGYTVRETFTGGIFHVHYHRSERPL